MKFGCFGFIRHIPLIEQAGFDTAELDICEITDLAADEFNQLCERLSASPLTFEAFSGLIPLSVRFYSKTFSSSYWLEHVEKAADRISRLGAHLVPFGAGKCRSIPPNYPNISYAKEQLSHLIRDICRIFSKYGILLAVEPLGPANSNFINRIEEAVNFTEMTHAANCRTMCDLRHMLASGDKMEAIQTYSTSILHAHIDYPLGTKRLFPAKNDRFNYGIYINALYNAGYEGILTIEATEYHDFLTEASESLLLLKDYETHYCNQSL